MSTQVTVVPEQPVDENMEKAVAEAKANARMDETPEERPEWLPEKFQSPADMAKAYMELEKKMSSQPKAPPQEKPADGKFDFSPFYEELMSTQSLSEESVQKLTDNGFSNEAVKLYVEGTKALIEAETRRVYETAGGEEQYQSMLAWAADNLPEEQIDAYNRIISGGDSGAIQMAVRGLKAQYVETNGKPAKLIQGETAGPSGGSFRSVAEVTAAMKDPRYAKDPAYRRDVENRLRNSAILGVVSR